MPLSSRLSAFQVTLVLLSPISLAARAASGIPALSGLKVLVVVCL